MKIFDMKNYLQLYKMLSKAEGNFTLTLPDGHTYTGCAKNPQLCVTLMNASDNTNGTLNIEFDNNRDALRSIDYIAGLK